jgi:hypothetical protein
MPHCRGRWYERAARPAVSREPVPHRLTCAGDVDHLGDARPAEGEPVDERIDLTLADCIHPDTADLVARGDSAPDVADARGGLPRSVTNTIDEVIHEGPGHARPVHLDHER